MSFSKPPVEKHGKDEKNPTGRHNASGNRPNMSGGVKKRHDHLLSRKVVLLGKTGVGKSAAGNTILGQHAFKSKSVTTECLKKRADVEGRNVSVVDTPGFCNTQMDVEKLITEIARSIHVSSPGPHAFLIVFPVNMRFTEQEQQIAEQIQTLFGEDVLKYSIILFTHGDQLKGGSIDKLIEGNSALRDLVKKCGGRYHVFNNENKTNRDQVSDLMLKIDTMIQQNGGGHYTCEMFEKAMRLKQERQREEEERQREEEEEEEEERQRQEEYEEVERRREEEEERWREEDEEEERRREEETRQREEDEEEERQGEEENGGSCAVQ